jgi:plasmid stabilization system protein ParE
MSARARKSVRWQSIALDDLTQIVDRIRATRPRTAQRLAARIFAKTDLLAFAPYLGAKSAAYAKARFLTHKGYVIYYTVHRDEVVVRAVVHGARFFRRDWLYRED